MPSVRPGKLHCIVVRMFNEEKYILKNLLSLVSQTNILLDKIIVVLVNNNSTDSTCDIVTDFFNLVETHITFIHINEPKQGPGYAAQCGYLFCRTYAQTFVDENTETYITFVDADSFLEPRCLEYIFESFEKGADIVIPKHIYDLDSYNELFDEAPSLEKKDLFLVQKNDTKDFWKFHASIGIELFKTYIYSKIKIPNKYIEHQTRGVGMSFRLHCLSLLGGPKPHLDEGGNHLFGEDLALGIQAKKHGCNLQFCRKAVVITDPKRVIKWFATGQYYHEEGTSLIEIHKKQIHKKKYEPISNDQAQQYTQIAKTHITHEQWRTLFTLRLVTTFEKHLFKPMLNIIHAGKVEYMYVNELLIRIFGTEKAIQIEEQITEGSIKRDHDFIMHLIKQEYTQIENFYFTCLQEDIN